MTERSTQATRRRLLRAGTGSVAGFLTAGCAGTGPDARTADAGDGPAEGTAGDDGGVYVPPHVHDRHTAGTGTSGGYAVGLAYTVPEYYWTVDGSATTRVTAGDDDTVHLLGYVWAADAGTALPDLDVGATLTRGGTTVAEADLVPTLSQRWGLFYGGNVALDTYTEYRVDIEIAGGTARRTRDFDGAFEREATVTLTLDFDRGRMDGITTRYLDASGAAGAVEPLSDDELPSNRRPDPSTLPGTIVASGRSGDASLAVLALGPDETPLEDGSTYLALLAATPYNDLRLPAMAVTGTLRRDGESAYDGPFEPTLDPDLGHHYGAAVDDVAAGDTLALSFPTPPQIARREGYETAFLSIPDAEFSLQR